MENYIIVGGGMAGIISANLLSKQGISFVGLEKTRRLGGSSTVGHHRLYQDGSVGFLKELCHAIEWTKIDDAPRERKKGDWTEVNDEEMESERFYLRSPFYHPTTSFNQFLAELMKPVEEKFQFEKCVEKIDFENRTVTCQDGSEQKFEKLIWCADLTSLLKCTPIPPSSPIKALKKLESPPGGLNLEMELKEPFIPFANSIVLPFRYKDNRLKALGINDPQNKGAKGTTRMFWVTFLERELSEDREEVAKVIRALKRELQKEFPELQGLILQEKIVFQAAVLGENAAEVKALELFPNVIYLGPQTRFSDTGDEVRHLDLTIENCKRFEDTFRANA